MTRQPLLGVLIAGAHLETIPVWLYLCSSTKNWMTENLNKNIAKCNTMKSNSKYISVNPYLFFQTYLTYLTFRHILPIFRDSKVIRHLTYKWPCEACLLVIPWKIKQKMFGVYSKCWTIWYLFTGTVNMRSKEMSVRVKEAIIKLKKPSSMAKSATWSQPNRACFSVTEDKIERPTKKQKMKEAVVKTQ